MMSRASTVMKITMMKTVPISSLVVQRVLRRQ
jgi:hypothetical protein